MQSLAINCFPRRKLCNLLRKHIDRLNRLFAPRFVGPWTENILYMCFCTRWNRMLYIRNVFLASDTPSVFNRHQARLSNRNMISTGKQYELRRLANSSTRSVVNFRDFCSSTSIILFLNIQTMYGKIDSPEKVRSLFYCPSHFSTTSDFYEFSQDIHRPRYRGNISRMLLYSESDGSFD